MSVATSLQPLADKVALIDEQRCIGCTLCIQACPVDAIVGASKLMHTVIAAWCTGCELCVPPCPVDCIMIHPLKTRTPEAYAAASEDARRRHSERNARLLRKNLARSVRAPAQREDHAIHRKRETIARIIERARERQARRS